MQGYVNYGSKEVSNGNEISFVRFTEKVIFENVLTFRIRIKVFSKVNLLKTRMLLEKVERQ